MSYVQHRPPAALAYPTYALDVARPAPVLANIEGARQENNALVKIVVGIIVALVVVAIVYWIWQQMQQSQRELTPNRRPASKQSTREMARALFKRLEDRGGVNETTMRSLQALGRR